MLGKEKKKRMYLMYFRLDSISPVCSPNAPGTDKRRRLQGNPGAWVVGCESQEGLETVERRQRLML